MLFQVLCGFEPIFYTTHPNEESKKDEVKYGKTIVILWCMDNYCAYIVSK